MVRKNIIIFGIIGVLLLAGASMLVFQSFSSRTSPEDKCKDIADSSERKGCLLSGYADWMAEKKKLALERKDAKVCNIFSDSNDKDSCILEVAQALSDSSLCLSIADVSRKSGCESIMIIQKNDFTACQEIENTRDREYCFEKAVEGYSGDITGLCGKFSSIHKEKCWEIYYTYRALEFRDESFCKKISAPEGQARCKKRL